MATNRITELGLAILIDEAPPPHETNIFMR